MNISESSHRQNFFNTLRDHIYVKSNEESLPLYTAATRVVLEWLGYNTDELVFIDGHDRGIDAWTVGESSVDIFQVKTHQIDDNELNLKPFDSSGVYDLQRAKDLLLTTSSAEVSKRELKDLLNHWAGLLRTIKLQGNKIDEIPVTLHLVVLGEGLQPTAESELNAFKSANANTFNCEDVPVRFYTTLHTSAEIIDRKWRQDNHDWIDKNGKKVESIQLYPWDKQYMNDNKNAIFYCRAIDLVKAYATLGYQLFEPNVRANITNSRVNREIRNSVTHARTRREFRFLNNGVTVTCSSFKITKSNDHYFTVHRPGIVNGLQTVVALHTAYQQLPEEDKEDFEQQCSLLIRLLHTNAVEDITRVVKATNNQNPMKLRNLVSNSQEQLDFARMFANELGWFYEAKEGSWEAFEQDPQRWRPRLDKRPKDFRVQLSGRSRKVRRIDNEELAQMWLAFIGYASEAVNEKKLLFEDRYYDMVFKQQIPNHGYDYGFSLSRAKLEAIDQSPNPHLMLIAFLTRQFANEVVPSASVNRKNGRERLGLDPMLPKAELDVELSKDKEFLLNQALGGMSVLFTEFVGFVLYRAFGRSLNKWGPWVRRNGSFLDLANGTTEPVLQRIETGKFDANDVLVVLWLVFAEHIQEMIGSPWGKSYQAAPVKSRFIYSKETRDKFYREIQEMDEYMKNLTPMRRWTIGIKQKQGLFEFVREAITGS